jgi:predicted O-methyltransferase YrrM
LTQKPKLGILLTLYAVTQDTDMARKTLNLTDSLYDYMVSVSVREHPVLKQLRARTARLPQADCQISAEQGQLLGLLVRLIRARRTIEVGVFTGYSALCTALALPPDGRIVACDISREWTDIARTYWKKAGVDHKINLCLAPAAETLKKLNVPKNRGTFDFAFIDADKGGYDGYYEHCLSLLKPGGVIAFDNMFMGGRVADEQYQSPDLTVIRRLNKKLHTDARVEISVVPIADGLTLALKK